MEFGDWMIADPAEYIGQPRLGINIVEFGGGDQRIQGGGPLSASIRSAEGPIFSSDRNTTQRSFGRIVGQADFSIIEEPGKGCPAVEHVVHGLGHVVMTRQLGPFGFHPGFQFIDPRFDELPPQLQALLGAQADQRSLQIKDDVNQAYRFTGQWRESGRLVFRARARGLGDIGKNEEFSSAMCPTCGLGDRSRLSVALIKPVVSGIGVGLKNAAEPGQMVGRMFPGPIRGVEKHCGGWSLATKRAVVPNISPQPTGHGFNFGQHRHRGVVAMKTVTGHDMLTDQFDQRRQSRGASADPIR